VETPLSTAIKVQNLMIIEYILASGADPQMEIGDLDNQQSPLFYAIELNRPDIVQILLSYKASCNNPAAEEFTALHIAAMSGKLAIAKTLIQHGAHINAVCSFGETPLHKAATAGKFEIVSYLLHCGASPDIKNESGRTALDVALTVNNSQEILHLLQQFISNK